MYTCVMQHNDTPEITSLNETLQKMTLNGTFLGAGLEKSALGKCTRGRIVTSVVENVACFCCDRQRVQCYLITGHRATACARLPRDHD